MCKPTTLTVALGIAILAISLGVYSMVGRKAVINTNVPALEPKSQTGQVPAPTEPTNPSEHSSILAQPIASALTRITKKPFGLKVSPQDSPVSPEKFAGYHTGVDFETLTSEQDAEIPVYAACSGPLLLKKWATGYGGVVVQKCQLADQDVTIVYGHLKLASITAKVNQALTAGEQLGILGKGYSVETDGERKHLHLSIHLGTTINLRGYVQTQAELAGWLDAAKYL